MQPPVLLSYGRQSVDDDDIAAVTAALRSDFLTTGPRVEEFERVFAAKTGALHAIACNSGTAALHLTALALDLGPEDAVVVPTITFLATANAVRMTGAEVVFADVDPDTGLLTAETLQAAIKKAGQKGLRVVAAYPVHLNGQLCDMKELASVVVSNDINLVEDACHALGVTDVAATNYSTAACFSTHPVKAITTGEGGVVASADPMFAQRLRRLRNHGMTSRPEDFKNRRLAFDGGARNPWYYEMHEIGWNYRLPDILCALGISQLKKLQQFFARRLDIASLYDRLLAPLAPMIRPVPCERPHGWHLYVVLIDFARLGMTRANVIKALRAAGIGSQVHYVPVHHQPYYSARYGDELLTGAEAYYARCLSIPMFPAMTDQDVERVATTFVEVVRTGAA